MTVFSLVKGLLHHLRNYNDHRAAVRHLRDLDDYLLRDVGIERKDIDPVVRGMLSRRTLDIHQPQGQKRYEAEEHRHGLAPAE